MKISKVVKKAIEHLGQEGCEAIIEEMLNRAAFDEAADRETYMAAVARRFKTWFGEPLDTSNDCAFVAQLLETGALSKIR